MMPTFLRVAVLSTIGLVPIAHGSELEWRVADSDRFSLFDGLQGECLDVAISSLESMPEAASPASIEDWHLSMVGDGEGVVSPFGKPECAAAQISWDADTQRYRRASVHRESIRVRIWSERRGACVFEAADRRIEAPCREGVVVPIPASGADAALVDVPESATRIVPEELVILGLGDSYGSGEGNPDRPTRWDPAKDVAAGNQTWLLEPERYQLPEGDPIWLDQLCHRSFWSHQTFTAMQVARTRPKARVVFLHYACSGAEIFDGLLLPQSAPPGTPQDLHCSRSITVGPREEPVSRRPDAGCEVRSAQLVAAAEDLCPSPAFSHPAEFPLGPVSKYHFAQARRHGGNMLLPDCPTSSKRPDLVLLSIGGNDTGFAQVAAWAVLPNESYSPATNWLFGALFLRNQRVCPKAFMDAGRCKSASAEKLITKLPRWLETTSDAIAVTFGVDKQQVIHSSYPDPVRKKRPPDGSPFLVSCPDDGLPEHYCGEPRGAPNPTNEWNTARLAGGSFFHGFTSDWQIRVTHSEACVLQTNVVEPLRDAILSAPTGFRVVDGIRDSFIGRGFCAGTPGPHTRTHQPGVEVASDDVFGAFQPHHWRAYAPMERLVRTTNDSYLTQTSSRHAGAMNGALHPTALGQAVMAEHVIPLAQDALARSPSADQAR